MVNIQREIHFINDCNAIVDYKPLHTAYLICYHIKDDKNGKIHRHERII